MKESNNNFFKYEIFAFFLYLFVKCIYFTSKKRFHHGVIDKKKTYIISFWHGELLMQPFNYQKLKKSRSKVMISYHKDGELVAKFSEYFNIGCIRGSSSQGGAKALIQAIRELKEGVDVALTPDGPRGPRYSIADGIIAVAQKTDLEILIFNCKPTSYWQLKSWDRFIIPKPFGTLNFYVSSPFRVTNMEIDDAKKLLKEKMLINALE